MSRIAIVAARVFNCPSLVRVTARLRPDVLVGGNEWITVNSFFTVVVVVAVPVLT
jgi:hypothetical protein